MFKKIFLPKENFSQGQCSLVLPILWSQGIVFNRKARMACAQSFTLWQQATIEFIQRDHSRRHRSHVQWTVHQVHKHYDY